MSDGFLTALKNDSLLHIVNAGCRRVALIGATVSALSLKAEFERLGLGDHVVGVFDPAGKAGGIGLRPWSELCDRTPDLIVICADAEKEALLTAVAAESWACGALPRVVVAGTDHLAFRDPVFSELEAPALVPSYATGYPHTRIHLYQCLKAAADNGLTGAIVEFGAFKGGTTAWLARAARLLGMTRSRVIGFDSWDGFPPRRSVLDLYEHPRCVFMDFDGVEAHTQRFGIELIRGDIVTTASRLENEELVLVFMDTDNYSSARTALEVCLPRLVVGGAIVFDHFTTTEDYVYTVGERMAAEEMLMARGMLHLHGTGVFVRLR
jgi:predicted O-methyltransferase YrrM